MKTALITGGCGFVGRNFAAYLAKHDYQVTCVDNLVSSSALHPRQWPMHLLCDVRFIYQDCREFFADNPETSFDLVIHLAAVVEGRIIIEQDPIAVAQDLSIDAHFFKWVTALNPKPSKVVYFSSSAAYPIKYQAPDDLQQTLREDMVSFERDIGMPDMTYGWAKLSGEYLARIAHDKYGLNVVVYRPFSGYGPDQHLSYPFPAILQRVVAGEDPIDIWSDTTRDFVHITDVVDCVMHTMDCICDGSALNIGTGIATRFSDLVQLMCKKVATWKHSAKAPPQVRVIEGKPAGVAYRVADTTKLFATGWRPQMALEDGIHDALQKQAQNSHVI